MLRMMTRQILVTGATGAQGGAVADALLRDGHQVRALTRRPETLAGKGMDVRHGDFDDFASLRAAAEGADAVFVVTTPFGSDLRTEVRHAQAMIEAATEAGVDHMVYTSAANADLRTGIPHFDSKLEVERYLIDRTPRHTIIAPAAFIDDKLGSWALESLRHGRYPVPLAGDRPLALIGVADIGAVAAQVFADPDTFDGHRIDLAAEELTPNQMAAALAEAIGKPVEHERVPTEQARRFSEDLAAMFDYFDRVGLIVDIDGLRSTFPAVRWQTFGQWVQGQDWPALLG
jgi:uncharacterized protein YbjT (DUF2867 family)